MKVALVCPYAWDRPGGVQVHVRQLAGRLGERGHETLVLAPASRGLHGDGVEVVGGVLAVPYNGSISPLCLDPRSYARIRRRLRAFGPDVVHVHEPFSPLTSLEALVAARAPLVGTFHAYARRSIALAALSPALRPLWKRMRVRLAVSEAAAEYAGRHFRGSVRVVPNGADVELFRDASPSSELPAGRKLMFVNRLEPRKGFGVAVRAFGLLAGEHPDLHLIVAGDGAERDAVGVLPAGIRDRVLMLGTVPHEDLPPFLAAADVSVAPALGRESFGIVLVEAMAAGLPVIASDIPGYREVVRDGLDGILVPPKDPAALAGAVRRVLADRDLWARLAAAGRERAEGFRWDVVAAQIEAAYREAASL